MFALYTLCFLDDGSFRFLFLTLVCCFVVGSSGTDPLSPGPHCVVDKLFGNTRYFVIKSNNYENVDITKTRRVSECVYVFRAFWKLALFRNCVAQIDGYQVACQFRNCVSGFESAQ